MSPAPPSERTPVAWVVQALESNSALPVAVKGTRGGSGGDPWRDDSDSDENDDDEPLEEVGSSWWWWW